MGVKVPIRVAALEHPIGNANNSSESNSSKKHFYGQRQKKRDETTRQLKSTREQSTAATATTGTAAQLTQHDTKTYGDGAVGGDSIGGLENGHALPCQAAFLAAERRGLQRQQPSVRSHLKKKIGKRRGGGGGHVIAGLGRDQASICCHLKQGETNK